jgi:Na+-translocating ferredoxin:NAD+ oxidoreductase RnfG subunit
MEDLTKKTLVLTLILFFIAIVLTALISSSVKQKEQEKEETQTTYIILDSSYPSYRDYENLYERNYYEFYWEKPERTNVYSYYSKKEQEKDFLGSYITKYIVSVLNKGNTGDYFAVVFNFKTQDGFEYSETITHYLRAGERKEFLYKDVQFERTEILRWGYEIERV